MVIQGKMLNKYIYLYIVLYNDLACVKTVKFSDINSLLNYII
jgi:hypothetical protein